MTSEIPAVAPAGAPEDAAARPQAAEPPPGAASPPDAATPEGQPHDETGGARSDAVAESIDGATGDWSVSGDAMRWSPDLAERGPEVVPTGPLAGLDVAAGFGSVLSLEAGGVRRLVSGALSSLTVAAGDVVNELRALTRGTSSDDDR